MPAAKKPHCLEKLANRPAVRAGIGATSGDRMSQWVLTGAAALGVAVLLAGHAEAGSIRTEGKASWYKMGTRTANGERYDPMGITAAHPSLPFNTKVRVTNPRSGESVVVRINDRGPFTGGRIIDLSQGAAQAIDLVKLGVAQVKIEVLGAAADAAPAPAPEPARVVLASADIEPVRESRPLLLRAEQRIGSSSR